MSIVHVISGPDHLAAVTPLAIDSRKKSWSVGFAWGMGHTIGMLIIGLIFLMVKEQLDVDLVSKYGEQFVGFLLIAIGIWALVRIKTRHGGKHKHVHPHVHEDLVHIHAHTHESEEAHKHAHRLKHRQNLFSALGIGIMHGVAGVSHIIAIIPTMGFESRTGSGLYLGGFVVGTLIAMVSYAYTLGLISQKSETANKNLSVFLRIFGGLLAIGVGIFWIVNTLL